MSLWNWLLGSNRETKLSHLAEAVAARSLPAVMHRLSAQSAGFGMYEMRGYIRARAGMVVQQEVAAVMKDASLAQLVQTAEQLFGLIMESVIRRVQREIAQRQLQPVLVRRAA